MWLYCTIFLLALFTQIAVGFAPSAGASVVFTSVVEDVVRPARAAMGDFIVTVIVIVPVFLYPWHALYRV